MPADLTTEPTPDTPAPTPMNGTPPPDGPAPAAVVVAAATTPAETPNPAAQAAVQGAALSTTINARLAPQDLEAERSVLGGVLLTNEVISDVIEVLNSEAFYRESHRKIFQAMSDLHEKNEPIDYVTLGDQLRKKGELESVGGLAYIAGLDTMVPSSGNIVRYARIVRDKALARRLVETAHAIAREGYEQLGDVDELLDSAEQQIFDVTEKKQKSAFTPLPTSVKRVFSNLEKLYENQQDITGVPTGFKRLDEMTAGFQKGDLIIVAGRPSMGKTSFVMNVAANVALEAKRGVAVFSLEMGADQLTTRMFSSEARVDGQRLRTGRLLQSDWPKLAKAAERLWVAPLYIDDSAGLTALEMRAKCRRLKAKLSGEQKEFGLVVIDYLQLMRGRSGSDNREQEISEISRGLKALARELEVPVIALSQLNRSLERREDKRPQMSDLRESGAIEQDADVIAFIYRDEVYNKETEDKGVAEIIIGKQRNGPTGTAHVAFLKDYTRFDNLADDHVIVNRGSGE